MNDKENYPSTPQRDDHSMHSNHSSPSRPLKPVSPNKVPNAFVGKLSFLQNDNIDAHFSHIHSTQEELQVQLQNLEVQTAQTALDLGQLVDRSKNNNSYLNKLLEGISSSNTLTKDDVEELIAKIDGVKEVISAPQSGAAKDTEGEAEAAAAVQRTLKEILAQLNSHPSNSDTKKQLDSAVEPVLSSISQFESTHTVQYQQLQSDLSASSASIVSAVAKQQSSQIEELTTKLSQQQTAIESLIAKQQTADELEAKVASLQSKYEQLCQSYQAKFDDLKLLKEEFAQLQQVTQREEEQHNDNSANKFGRSKLNKFKKLNQLHSSNLNDIQGSSFAEKMKKKRIASTPNKLFFDAQNSSAANTSGSSSNDSMKGIEQTSPY